MPYVDEVEQRVERRVAEVDRWLAEITPEGGKVTYVHDGRDWVVSVAGADGRMTHSATDFWFADAVLAIKRMMEAEDVRA